MKCIECGRSNADNNESCLYCEHPFVFSSTTVAGVNFTDEAFANIVQEISANNRLYFTPRQLQWNLEKFIRHQQSEDSEDLDNNFTFADLLLFSSFFVFAISIIAFFAFFKLDTFNPFHSDVPTSLIYLFLFGIFLLILQLGLRKPSRQDPKGIIIEEFIVTSEMLQSWIDNWTAVNDPLDKLLPPPENVPSATSISPEISNYSFDRVIICENDAIAQMLIANNVHFEYNCAILSINGYPQNIFETVIEMLRQNDNLKVYILHDGSPRGMALISNIQNGLTLFPQSWKKIYDLGMFIYHINKSYNILQSSECARESQELPSEVRANLSQEELAWLDSGKIVELESFSPQEIMQMIIKRITDIEGSGRRRYSSNSSYSGDTSYGDGWTSDIDSFG